jgi:hypothetical protein
MNITRALRRASNPCARWNCLLLAGLISLTHSTIVFADPLPDTEKPSSHEKRIDPAQLTGKISTIQDVRVLTLWGPPHDRGFAHGYLLADDIVNLLDGYLRHSVKDPAAFEKQAKMLLKMMAILPRYQQELSGMLEGIQAKLGADVPLKIMQRPLNYDDLMALICIPELARAGCSSFAAWGPMTKTGETLAGRNLDWFAIPVLDGKEIIIVNMPDEKQNVLGWVSITWPGFIGCLTGMNSEGVSVSMHDVFADGPSIPMIFTPRGMALRESVETARAASAVEDVQCILRRRFALVGNNVPISVPWKQGMTTAAAVFEYDSHVTNGFGVTTRLDDGNGKLQQADALDRAPVGTSSKQTGESSHCDYLLCTNLYRARAAAESCDRYSKFKSGCEQIADKHDKLDVAAGWKLLRRVECTPDSRIRTYHSVIFEPNQKKMHVAFAHGTRPAAECEPMTLDLAQLLRIAGK